MFEGQYLFGGTAVFSPWMSRSGDNMLATLEVIAGSGITVEIFEKNNEQPGDGTGRDMETFTQSGPGLSAGNRFNGLLELVRYKFTATGSATDRTLFRMLSPVWFDDVSA